MGVLRRQWRDYVASLPPDEVSDGSVETPCDPPPPSEVSDGSVWRFVASLPSDEVNGGSVEILCNQPPL